jgi:hypothetical protein
MWDDLSWFFAVARYGALPALLAMAFAWFSWTMRRPA